MALRLEEIRALAERVAASHALEVVDLEYQGGGGKHRTLRVFIEKDAGERAKLRDRVAGLMTRRESEEEDAAASEAGPGEDGVESEVLSEDEEAFLDGLPSVGNLQLLSGITHEDCEAFSRDFGTVLDVEELVPGTEYLLEVSSPGLDRRLIGEADYQRFAGSLAKLQTFEAVGGNRHWQGRIVSLNEGLLELDASEGQKARKGKKGAADPRPAKVEIALANIEKAQLVPEF